MKEIFKPYSIDETEHILTEHAMIICEDSLKTLKNIESTSIDLIIADPPYNLGKDFGNQSDSWIDKKDYFNWCYTWIDECFRVLKDTGTLYLMNATQNMPYLSVYIQEHYHIVCDIVWSYDSSGVQSKRKFGSLFEPIIMATKHAKSPYIFNKDDILVETKTGAQRGIIDYRKNPPRPYNTLKVPGNVWSFPRVRYQMNEYENHPSQKPETLIERMIKTSSEPNGIVLDPFSGTFTTCAVGLRLNRRVIGIELNPLYYQIGLRRTGVAQYYNGHQLFKDKGRKTRNLSKKDHLLNHSNQVDEVGKIRKWNGEHHDDQQ